MLYPENIIISKKKKISIIKEKLKNLMLDVKHIIKYWLFDRSNLFKKIKIKLHI